MKRILFALLVLSILQGCGSKDKNADPGVTSHEFHGIIVMDDIGQTLGTAGTDDGDWKNDASWTPSEYSILDFPDTVSLDSTWIDTTGMKTGPGQDAYVVVFPNPLADDAEMYMVVKGCAKFKVAVVDNYFNRLYTLCIKGTGPFHVPLDFSDHSKYVIGEMYRVYYSLSVKGNLNFYKGHGDLLICKDLPQQECLSHVH